MRDRMEKVTSWPRGVDDLVRLVAGQEALVHSVEPLAADRAKGELKHAGYGEPMLVSYELRGVTRKLVFRTQSPNWFGHDRRSDRATLALLAADTYGEQPRHVRVLDVGAIRGEELVSLRNTGEFYLVTTYEEGAMYSRDFDRVLATGRATEQDVMRAEVLARHLVDLHAPPNGLEDAVPRYRRATRDLLGSGEGIFGISDSYPDDFAHLGLVRVVEELSLAWRWKLRSPEPAFLRRTHGDFHPYNILFRGVADLMLLDASRGGFGDPADDVAALVINYWFAGLRRPATWPQGFMPLWTAFFGAYAERARETGALLRLAPFFSWRALVLASPIWYPDVADDVRRQLLTTSIELLEGKPFDPAQLASELATEQRRGTNGGVSAIVDIRP